MAKNRVQFQKGYSLFELMEDFGSEDKHHFHTVTGGNLDMLDHPAFKWVNTMIGNVKNSLRGSCHTIGAKHLPRHLAEYCYRFNNRFELRDILPRLAKAAVRTPPMPYKLLRLADVCG